MMKIDLVYLWVDGSDREWMIKRNAYLPADRQTDPETFCEGRLFDNQELRYSLRSVEMYAPWINHIYIVTDNQVPKWLDLSNKKVTIINQNDILPKESIPCYNSPSIELALVNIPNLSENFLYANDDMMFGRAVEKSFFFTSNGEAICRFTAPNCIQKIYDIIFKSNKDSDSTCLITIQEAGRLIKEDFGKDFTQHHPHHNIDAYIKSSMKECMARYQQQVKITQNNRFRSPNDLQRHIFSLWAVVNSQAIESTSRMASLLKRFTPFGLKLKLDSYIVDLQQENNYKLIKSLNPALLCFNDNQFITSEHRQKTRLLLDMLYPHKSSFEK